MPPTNTECKKIAKHIAKLEQYFQEHEELTVYNDPGEKFVIVPTQERKNNIIQRKYFAINTKNEPLGKGAFGKVYPADSFNSQGELIDTSKDKTSKKIVVKVIDIKKASDKGCSLEDIYQEAQIQSNYLPTKIIRTNQECYILTPDLGNDFSKAYEKGYFGNLTFTERAEIAWKLAMNFNLHHHHTPRTGPALRQHHDVKPQNTMLNIVEKDGKKEINVASIDFGLADLTEGDPNKLIQTTKIKGTPLYFSPQMAEGKHGAKNDVAALVSLLGTVFGNQDPCESKIDNYNDGSHIADLPYIPYKYPEIEEAQLPKFNIPIELKPLLFNFLDRMQNTDYDTRPDSDEVLEFFTALHNLCLVSKHDSDSQEKQQYKYGAKLALLSSGLWRTTLGLDAIKEFDDKQTQEWIYTDEVTIKDFSSYDWNTANLEFCQGILNSYAYGNLNKSLVIDLVEGENTLDVESVINQYARVIVEEKNQADLQSLPSTLDQMINSLQQEDVIQNFRHNSIEPLFVTQLTDFPHGEHTKTKGPETTIEGLQEKIKKLDKIYAIAQYGYNKLKELSQGNASQNSWIQESIKATDEVKNRLQTTITEYNKDISQIRTLREQYNKFIQHIRTQIIRLEGLRGLDSWGAEKKAKALQKAINNLHPLKDTVIAEFMATKADKINDKMAFYHFVLSYQIPIPTNEQENTRRVAEAEFATAAPSDSEDALATPESSGDEDTKVSTLNKELKKKRGLNLSGLIKKKATAKQSVDTWIKDKPNTVAAPTPKPPSTLVK